MISYTTKTKQLTVTYIYIRSHSTGILSRTDICKNQMYLDSEIM